MVITHWSVTGNGHTRGSGRVKNRNLLVGLGRKIRLTRKASIENHFPAYISKCLSTSGRGISSGGDFVLQHFRGIPSGGFVQGDYVLDSYPLGHCPAVDIRQRSNDA